VANVSEHEMLITITVRRDPGYPAKLFLTLRRYDLNADDPPTDSVETVKLEDALGVADRWIRSLVP
jgi:hypothetical protein